MRVCLVRWGQGSQGRNKLREGSKQNDRIDLASFTQQLTDSVARLAELEAAAIVRWLKPSRSATLLPLKFAKRQTRARVVLLQKAIKQLENQTQLDAQAYMIRESEAFMSPLTKAFDEATAALALPPSLTANRRTRWNLKLSKRRQTFRWFGNPKASQQPLE